MVFLKKNLSQLFASFFSISFLPSGLCKRVHKLFFFSNFQECIEIYGFYLFPRILFKSLVRSGLFKDICSQAWLWHWNVYKDIWNNPWPVLWFCWAQFCFTKFTPICLSSSQQTTQPPLSCYPKFLKDNIVQLFKQLNTHIRGIRRLSDAQYLLFLCIYLWNK